MKCQKSTTLFFALLLLCSPVLLYSESSIKEQVTSEFLTLKLQSQGLRQTIKNLESERLTLSQQLTDSQADSETLKKQLSDIENLLKAREAELMTLTQQLNDLESSFRKSQIETALIAGGIGVIVGGVVVGVIIAVAVK